MSDLTGFRQYLTEELGRTEGTAVLYTSHVRKALEVGPRVRLRAHLAPKTLASVRDALMAWAKFTEDEELGEQVRQLKLPPPRRKKAPEVLTWEELDRLRMALREVEQPDRECLQILLQRGFRVGDLLRVPRTNVQEALRKRVLTFTAKGRRILSWDTHRFHGSLESLYKWGDQNRKGWKQIHELVSRSKRDNYYAARQHLLRVFKRCCYNLGVPPEKAFLHVLRATHARQYYERVHDLIKLQRYMDWVSIKNAILYVDRFTREELEELAVDLPGD